MNIEEAVRADGWLTFEEAEERLVEAVLVLWRMPDRERGWQRIQSRWPDVMRHSWFGDYGDAEAEPRTPPATRRDIADMQEALGWMAHVADRDRRLVGLAIRQLARGAREVRWAELLGPMGMTRGRDGLRMRYARAIAAICAAVNMDRTAKAISAAAQ